MSKLPSEFIKKLISDGYFKTEVIKNTIICAGKGKFKDLKALPEFLRKNPKVNFVYELHQSNGDIGVCKGWIETLMGEEFNDFPDLFNVLMKFSGASPKRKLKLFEGVKEKSKKHESIIDCIYAAEEQFKDPASFYQELVLQLLDFSLTPSKSLSFLFGDAPLNFIKTLNKSGKSLNSSPIRVSIHPLQTPISPLDWCNS